MTVFVINKEDTDRNVHACLHLYLITRCLKLAYMVLMKTQTNLSKCRGAFSILFVCISSVEEGLERLRAWGFFMLPSASLLLSDSLKYT